MTVNDFGGRTLSQCLHFDGVPRAELRQLLMHVLKKPHSWLIAHDDERLTTEQQAQFDAFVQRRLEGEPMAYVLGWRGFWDFEVKVTPDVLIPRHDTERLVEVALEALQAQSQNQTAPFNPVILDLGTGSGVVAIALARENPTAQVIATDLGSAALAVAKENVQRLQARVQCIQSNWFGALATALGPGQRFDLIVSNPPYIHAEDAHLQQGDLRFEPSDALTDGADGLSDLKTIVLESRHWLKPAGSLWLEHGYDQGSAVRALLEAAGYREVRTERDLTNHERVSGGIAPGLHVTR